MKSLYWIICISLFGYPICATIRILFELSDNTISYIYRLLYVIPALILILKTKKQTIKSSVYILIVFWVIYVSRMYYDLLLKGITAEAYNQDASFYFSYAILGCFVPCLCLALHGHKIDFDKLNKALWVSVLVSSFALIGGIYYQYGSFHFVERVALNVDGTGRVLSAGIISQTGVCLAIISFFNIIHYNKNYILNTVFLFIGIGLTVLGSTKGAAINLGLVLIILIFANLRRFKDNLRLKVWIAALLIIGLIYLPKIDTSNINLFNRFQWLNERLETGDEPRLRAWKGGLTQFANHPLVGDKMFETTLRGYPHNIFVEVLMATGYVGFIPFIIVLGAAFLKVKYTLQKQTEKSLIGCLFLVHFIQSLVSGGLYSIVGFWVGLGIVLSINKS